MYAIGKILIDIVVVMFLVGMAGSAVVVLISFVHDFRELFGDDETPTELDAPPPHTSRPVAEPAAYSYSAPKRPVHHF